jgi:hypothetical protein
MRPRSRKLPKMEGPLGVAAKQSRRRCRRLVLSRMTGERQPT